MTDGRHAHPHRSHKWLSRVGQVATAMTSKKVVLCAGEQIAGNAVADERIGQAPRFMNMQEVHRPTVRKHARPRVVHTANAQSKSGSAVENSVWVEIRAVFHRN